MRYREQLHQYQRRAVQFILKRRRVALWMGLGLGKTATTLTAITDLLDGQLAQRVLVIAPLRVANSVWRQEAAQWDHTRHLNIQIATGSQRKRLMALHMDSDVVVINRENLPWLATYYGQKWPFDTVVIDEASSFKNPSAQRFKALKRMLPHIINVIELTGTPSPNGLIDLWSQVYLLDYGQALGKTMSAFKGRFFDSDYMGYNYTPKPGAFEEIYTRIADRVLSMDVKDYLELPKRIDLVESVTLPEPVMAHYKKLEKDLFLEFQDGTEVDAVNAAVLANKLLQAANGHIYIDENRNWSELHAAKLDALEGLLERVGDEPVLIAYNFKSDLERLQARFPNARQLDKDPETIHQWNRGEIPLLLAHPASASMGLNLQHGGAIVVWFSLCWNLEHYLQFNGRVYRQGQERPVRIVHLVAEGTIDERVLKVLESKDATQESLLRALR